MHAPVPEAGDGGQPHRAARREHRRRQPEPHDRGGPRRGHAFAERGQSYDRQYYLSADNILGNLRRAQERGPRGAFLLDPTLNQCKCAATWPRSGPTSTT